MAIRITAKDAFMAGLLFTALAMAYSYTHDDYLTRVRARRYLRVRLARIAIRAR